MKEPLSIHLDSEHVILRQLGEEVPEPATLSGYIVLDLADRHDIKDLRARISYSELIGSHRTHSYDQPVYQQTQSFLPSFDGTSHSSQGPPQRQGSSSALSTLEEHSNISTGPTTSNTLSPALNSAQQDVHADKHTKHHGHSHHSHTFNQGVHSYPFSFVISGSSPASLRLGNAPSFINYQLIATATKAGVFGGKWTTKKTVNIVRGLSPEAAEFNQTLEIDNTWPGKVIYSLTLPHKAFCAGESIPIALKFTPIGKGVRVTHLVTSIKETVTISPKSGHSHFQPHTTTHDIFTKKHDFHPRSSLTQTSSGRSQNSPHSTSLPPSRSGSSIDLASMAQQRLSLADNLQTSYSHSNPSGSRTRDSHQASTGGASPSSGASHGSCQSTPATAIQPGGTGSSHTGAGGHTTGASGHSPTNMSRQGSRTSSPERIYYGRSALDPEFVGVVDEDGSEDVDVDAVIQIALPVSATPSHPIEPIHITHKIRWSAFIHNLDGHTSELRCALPLHILSSVLSEEARLASSGTRSLLFGPSGVLVPAAEGIQQVDLPSYGEHILDRVANIENANSGSNLAASGHNSSVTAASFARSPWATPMTSPQRSPGHQTDVLGRSNCYFPEHNMRTINWADSELLNTLEMSLPEHQQYQSEISQRSSSQGSSHNVSPAVSRPGSRPPSRPSSRPTSRAGSPTRGDSANNQPVPPHTSQPSRSQVTPPSSSLADQSHGAQAQKSSSGFFNMHLPKPLKPFTSLGGTSSHSSSAENLQERAHSTGGLSGLFHHGHRAPPTRQHSAGFHETSMTPQHSPPPTNKTSFPAGSSGNHGDVAYGVSAALEAHQEQQTRRNKGKGKKRGGIFASMHADEEEEDDEDDEDTRNAQDDHSHSHTHTHTHTHPPHLDSEVPLDETGSQYLSQVPSYEVARRGFLGGGVPPLSLSIGLPSYDESETRK